MLEATSPDGELGTNGILNAVPILPLGKPPALVHRWLAQSGQSPVRGHDESASMNSQLG